jgi:hypothetical protein
VGHSAEWNQCFSFISVHTKNYGPAYYTGCQHALWGGGGELPTIFLGPFLIPKVPFKFFSWVPQPTDTSLFVLFILTFKPLRPRWMGGAGVLCLP